MDGADVARAIIDANQFLTLATADGEGRPWGSPVWYAPEAASAFLWVSRPDARHSRNVAARPEVGLVIFDSTVAPADAQAVYVEATAEELVGTERERAIAVFSRRSLARGLPAWTVDDVVAPAEHRLYRATAVRVDILDGHDRRVPVALEMLMDG